MRTNLVEAISHVNDSVAESIPYDFDIESLCQHLIKAAAEEIQAWYMYIAPANFLTGLMIPDVEELFLNNGKDELDDHFFKLLTRLNQLGANVQPLMDLYNLQNCTPNKFIVPMAPYDVVTLIEDNIKAEQQAIATYNAICQMTEGKDFVTHAMARQILADEDEHLTDLEDLLASIKSRE